MKNEGIPYNEKNTKKTMLNEITEQLENGIKDLFNSEKYRKYLNIMSRFHNYSLNNTLLIAFQNPKASYVAGYSAWKNKFQRNVKKGEKGIKIIAPCPYKVQEERSKQDPVTNQPLTDKNGNVLTEKREITVATFKVVSVFDVSQTEGKELPQLTTNLTGEIENYKTMLTALQSTSEVPVTFEPINNGANGYFDLSEKRIVISDNLSETHTIKTLIHEIAHSKLHDIDINAPKEEKEKMPDRYTREVQAESIAYSVCQYYGIDTSDYSFGYIAGWSKGRELNELKGSLETIRITASELIDSIDKKLTELDISKVADKPNKVFNKSNSHSKAFDREGQKKSLQAELKNFYPKITTATTQKKTRKHELEV